MRVFVVETTYDPPLTDGVRQEHQDRLYPCMALRGVAWLRSFEAADRRRKVCIFSAPDAEALRESLRGAGLGFDRLWAADARDPEILGR
jgi:hypothetical protein